MQAQFGYEDPCPEIAILACERRGDQVVVPMGSRGERPGAHPPREQENIERDGEPYASGIHDEVPWVESASERRKTGALQEFGTG